MSCKMERKYFRKQRFFFWRTELYYTGHTPVSQERGVAIRVILLVILSVPIKMWIGPSFMSVSHILFWGSIFSRVLDHWHWCGAQDLYAGSSRIWEYDLKEYKYSWYEFIIVWSVSYFVKLCGIVWGPSYNWHLVDTSHYLGTSDFLVGMLILVLQHNIDSLSLGCILKQSLVSSMFQLI